MKSLKKTLNSTKTFFLNPQDNKEGLKLLESAIEKAGYTGKVKIGMDVAASEFYIEADKQYDLDFKTDVSIF